MDYVWTTQKAALSINIDKNYDGNIAQPGETPASTTSKTVGFIDPAITFEQGKAIADTLATIYGFIHNTASLKKTTTYVMGVD